MPLLSHTAAIILAGGTSSRMGQERNKLLLPLYNRPVLAHVLEAALTSLARPIVLVLGYQSEKIRSALAQELASPDIQLVENPDYMRGQSTSMQAGLRALLALPEIERPAYALFLLGDQPLITAEMIDRLIQFRDTSGKGIVLPLYQGQRGNPVLFSLAFAQELLQVSGDEGGRGILKRHPDEIATLEMGEVHANVDVDTWEAYQHILAIWEQKEQE